jgi:hypothetical protein
MRRSAGVSRLGGGPLAGAFLPGNDRGDPLGDISYGADMDEVLQFDGDPKVAFRGIHDDR